jgi:hypothetical protein
MASIEREVENALLNVVSGVTGVNFFTSERGTARTMPSVTVQAQIGSEELVPFSGVFKTPASITYVARADTTARVDFDAKFYDILEQLYRSPDLASYLTDHSNITFYVAKVTGDSPAVISQNRTWSRTMTLDITATSKLFFPSNLSNLSLWLKADAGVTLSGANVTAWADQSGNGKNATATGTPTLSTVSGKTFMNFAGGYFAGNELITSPYATIMCVARFSSTRDISMMFEQYSDGDNLAFYRGFNYNNGFRIYNGSDLSSLSLTDDDQTYLFGVTVNNDTGTLYLNATEDGSGYCGEITPSGSYYLGRWVGEPLTTTELQMAEIVIYNRVLTTPERQQVEAYLNSKYAIF